MTTAHVRRASPAQGIIFSPPSPVLQSPGPPLARAIRARSNSPRVLWTAETAQRARLVAKAQADVCIAVARAASAGALEGAPQPQVQAHLANLGQDMAHVPKVIRQSSSPRVLQRAVSAPPVQGVLQFGTPNGTPKVGYRPVRGSSPRLGAPPRVAQVVAQAPTPRSPVPGRPPPNPVGRPPVNQSPLKRASSPRNVFGMESPGRKAQTPSPSPMQRHRETALHFMCFVFIFSNLLTSKKSCNLLTLDIPDALPMDLRKLPWSRHHRHRVCPIAMFGSRVLRRGIFLIQAFHRVHSFHTMLDIGVMVGSVPCIIGLVSTSSAS